MTRCRVLIAGIGNIFLGDDAFGVEVARRLQGRPLPAHVRVMDFGIRGFDLAYELLNGYETVVLIDAAPRGEPPGTLYLIEPEVSQSAAEIDTHAMDPVKVLRFAAALGGPLPRVLLVGCEPEGRGAQGDMSVGMSPPVQSAIDRAITMIESLVVELLSPVQPAEAARGVGSNHA